MRVIVASIVVDALWTVPKGMKKRVKEQKIRRRIETIKTTEKSPGDLRRLAATQISVEDRQLTLVRETHKDLK